jgi:transposase-like protein
MEGLRSKRHRNYPLLLKKKIVREVICGIKSKIEVSRDYDVPRNNVNNWIKRFGSDILKKETQEVIPLHPMENPKNPDLGKQLRSLEEENLTLRKKLVESDLRAEALNTLIDLCEENYGLSLRKNSGAKQSKD